MGNNLVLMLHLLWRAVLQWIGGERKGAKSGEGLNLVKLVSASQQTYCLKQICSTVKKKMLKVTLSTC